MAEPSEKEIKAAARAYCAAADVHLMCTFPECDCKQIRAGMPAALLAAARVREKAD